MPAHQDISTSGRRCLLLSAPHCQPTAALPPARRPAHEPPAALQIAIVGRPNVGKSSLLNRWTRTDRAIVTDIAGTTRDVLESPLSIGGVPATLLDTAGVRETEDTVEGIGVERARRAAREADLVVWVVSAADGVTGDDRAVLEGVVEGAKGKVVAVINKADIQPQFGAGDVPPDVRDKCEVSCYDGVIHGLGRCGSPSPLPHTPHGKRAGREGARDCFQGAKLSLWSA